MAKLVRFRVLDGIAVITLDAPPVNALSAALRAGLWEAITRIDTNDDIKAAGIIATGRLFSAGADIREFSSTMKDPALARLCDRIEACAKPVIAATHGQALGGGTEVLLAAHYRLATPDARIGLPEVNLGLIPGAGGTQRLPRLIGAERALQMIVSATSIDAGSALRAGLIDGIVQGDLASGAIAFAQNLIARGHWPRRVRDNRTHLKDGRAHQAAIAKVRSLLKGNPLHAPHRAVDCVEVATILPFDAALAFEADAFERCLEHPQSRALRYIFLAERNIDDALMKRDGARFNLVEPMGKAAVLRLRKAIRAAAEHLLGQKKSEAQIDGAMVDYGFRKGPFGGKEKGDPDTEIVQKILAALMVEGATCVEQGAVQRASDIDVLAVHGLGFPRRHAGPMWAAQSIGLIGLRKELRIWGEESDIWKAPKLLDEAIKNANSFEALP